jgi:regulator of sigma E protease
MLTFLSSLFWVAIVLGIMILIHEFGHYAAAKYFGVRVEVFSIGFGKRLLGWKRGETDYRISALPLGGYVKMSGENFMEQRTGDPREFLSHPRWHRFVIAIAGPAMNILLAVGLLTGIYMVRYEHPAYLDQPAVIGYVVEDSPAAKAGLQSGDRIIRIDGKQNPTWEDTLLKIMMSPGQQMDLGVQRGSEVFGAKLVPQKVGKDEVGESGLVPDQQLVITDIEHDLPAAKAGLRIGDEVVAMNGLPVRSVGVLLKRLQENGDKPAQFTYVRDGVQHEVAIQPQQYSRDGETYFRIGIQSNPVRIDKLPLGAAFMKSLDTNRKTSGLVLELVEKMVQRKVSMRQMSGPIGIARAAGEAARQPGWVSLLSLMSTISLQLGLFNLFPIPILDGGIILLLILEALMRRDISLQVKERIYQAAFVFLVLFAVLVIYNDIAKTISG